MFFHPRLIMQIIFIPLKAGPIAYLSFNELHFFKLRYIFLSYTGLQRVLFLNLPDDQDAT